MRSVLPCALACALALACNAPPPLTPDPLPASPSETAPAAASASAAAAPAAAAPASASAPPPSVHTPEGFDRTELTLRRITRTVKVTALPAALLPLDVFLTGSLADHAVGARLATELGWPDLGAVPALSPDGKYALFVGGKPRELAVYERTEAGLGARVRRGSHGYASLLWASAHDLVAYDGGALLRADGSGAAPFARIGSPPRLVGPRCASPKDVCVHRIVHAYDAKVEAALTSLETPLRWEVVAPERLDLRTGVSAPIVRDDDSYGPRASGRFCAFRTMRGDAGDPRSMPSTLVCSPAPWTKLESLLVTTTTGARWVASSEERVVAVADHQLHVFDMTARTERVYPWPDDASLYPRDGLRTFEVLDENAHWPLPKVLDLEAGTLANVDAWIPNGDRGYDTFVLPPAGQPGQGAPLRLLTGGESKLLVVEIR